jgi:hypothetical protein
MLVGSVFALVAAALVWRIPRVDADPTPSTTTRLMGDDDDHDHDDDEDNNNTLVERDDDASL